MDATVLRRLQAECDALESEFQKCLLTLKQESGKTAEEAESIRQLEADVERKRAAEEAERCERTERRRKIEEYVKQLNIFFEFLMNFLESLSFYTVG